MGASARDSTTILWGAAAIAEFLGLSTAACFHLLEQGRLPAHRVGRRWAADREVLRAFFADPSREAPDAPAQ